MSAIKSKARPASTRRMLPAEASRASGARAGGSPESRYARGVPEARLDDSVSVRSESAVPPGEGDSAASGADSTYSGVAELPFRIERCDLLPLARDTTGGFTKISTVVRLTGNGHEGQGEDITWDQIDQIEQLRRA